MMIKKQIDLINTRMLSECLKKIRGEDCRRLMMNERGEVVDL